MTQELIQKTLPTLHSFRLASTWEGAFWKVFSCACFAAINVLVKDLSKGGVSGPPSLALPTDVIFFFQNLVGTFLMLPFLFTKKPNARLQFNLLPKHNRKLHLIRVIAAAMGLSLWYLTVKHMPLAEAVALSFTGPVFTVIGAKFLLNESIGKQRLMAICLSLLGAFIITRPDLALLQSRNEWNILALLPLGSAIAFVYSKLATRQLTLKGESPDHLATYLLLGMVPFSFLLAFPEWTMPTPAQWIGLILLGILAAMAHASFGRAYKLAEVTFLTPIGFSKFLFSTLLGYYCFSEIPEPALWIGMAVIAGSVFLLSYKISRYSTAKRFRSS